MSSNDDHSDEIEESQREQQRLLQEQIDQSNAEIEQKRAAVFNERLNILKSQSAPNWNPVSMNPVNNPKVPTHGRKGSPLPSSKVGINNNNNPLKEQGV